MLKKLICTMTRIGVNPLVEKREPTILPTHMAFRASRDDHRRQAKAAFKRVNRKTKRLKNWTGVDPNTVHVPSTVDKTTRYPVKFHARRNRR